jgi:hypothetical protein
MNEIEIIKLPTIGQPFSFKTRKQGRRDGINFEITESNRVAIEIAKRERHDKAKQLGNYLKDYKGNHPFLCSIQKQMKIKGLNKLTKRQIDIGYRTFKRNVANQDEEVL